jgi:hypothetical protein
MYVGIFLCHRGRLGGIYELLKVYTSKRPGGRAVTLDEIRLLPTLKKIY